MKNFALLIAFLCVISCRSSTEDLLNGIWVGIEEPEADMPYEGISHFIQFENDSLFVKYFDGDSFNIKTSVSKVAYANDHLIINEGGILDSILISKLDREELIFEPDTIYSTELWSFKTLKKYQQGENRNKFIGYLSTSSFIRTNDGVEIEFSNNKFIYPSNFGSKEPSFWQVQVFEDELFLIAGPYPTIIFQVKFFNARGFTLCTYSGDENLIFYKRKTPEKSLDLSLLNGEWIGKHSNVVVKDPDVFGEEYCYREHLLISDQTIFRCQGNRKVESSWEPGIHHSKIIFTDEQFTGRRKGWWDVLELSTDKLVVKRIPPFRRYLIDPEIVEFRKLANG